MKLKRFTTQLIAAGLIAVPLLASAAGLGKMSVNSALGQPLEVEIELFAADKAELDSLAASLASDQAFRDAKVEYAPVLSSLRFAVEKKPSGKSVLKVTSSRPVNDPFVDMLIELNWPSGRLVREYTLLLDPPGTSGAQTVAPVGVAAPQVPATPAKPVVTPFAPTVEAPKPAPAPVVKKPAADTVPPAESKPKPASPKPAPQAATNKVAVKRGDTLAGIATRVRPEGISLEQTLVGLYRDNSAAFDGNMNRLKTGKTLNVPNADALAAITPKEASREIKLQADDWRAYRQKLATAVTATPAAQPAPGQTSSGKIAPKVDDRAKPASDAQKDVLKLSKTPAKSAKPDEAAALKEKLRAQEEDATAREKALKESDTRVAMLEKQVQDLQVLTEMKEKAKREAEAKAATAAPVLAPPVPTPAVKPVAPVVNAPAPVETPVAEKWYEPLLANPMVWGSGVAALGLGGVLWWMLAGGRRRKASATFEDSIMSGGDVHPNTVVGAAASGGSINTGDTSFLTDFSQAGLGAIDTHDVDPIAEAEVYMAYGRDAQAEEILKEAIVKTPDRHEIRVKLLEIYAARRNTAAFAGVAGDLYAALGSKSSPLWDKAAEMGRSIDPTNPLYGGVQSEAPAVATTVAATSAIAGGAMELAQAEVVADPVPEMPTEPVADNAPMEFESAGNVLEFDSGVAAAPAAPVAEGMDFDLSDLDLPAAGDELKLDLGLDQDGGTDSAFDFSGLDLDLGDAGGSDLESDEAGTKLDLARAYLEMGDKDGAREILGEVLNEGSDKQKADAKGMLSSLG
ncbi:MAG: FimV/HubP family polar landmark protein [Thiobacillus sp.]